MILITTFVVVSCGPAATAVPPAPESPTQALLPENTFIAELTQTPTAEPMPSPTLTPTDTPLPPLELPTEIPNAPAQLAWDGMPTYPADSQPGFAFRVLYDPETWALTTDPFGFPALGHRRIPYCVISVTSGRGLPRNITVEHDMLYTSTVTFDVGTAYENGVRKFVTYTGGDGVIITGFMVTFEEEADECLADAVTVLTTLRSVPVSQTTPQP